MDQSQFIFNILFSCGILFGIGILIYNTFYVTRKNKAQRSLILFILFFTLNNLQIILVDNFTSQADCYLNNLHPFLFFVFVVPYFHSFIVYYLKIEEKVSQYVALAKILFGLGMIFRAVYIPFLEIGDCKIIGTYVKIEEIIIALFSLFLFFKVVQLLFFRKKLYQFILTFDRLKWIKQFLFLGGLVLLFWIMAIVFNIQNIVNPQVFVYYPLRISSSVLLYWVGYSGFYKNFLTDERIEIRKETINLPALQFTSDEDQFEGYSETMLVLMRYVLSSQCYLDASYTVEQLAKEVRLSKRIVSKEISLSDRNNFNDFLNFYRVQRAITLLNDARYFDYTNEALGYDCGFNSKSTFYRAFKKCTNKSPNDCRNTIN